MTQPDPLTEPQFGIEDCTCVPWTTRGGMRRYCQPGDTVNDISGWERGGDCPHHAPAVVPPVDRAALRDRIRRAVCEAEGFAWDSDMLEPDEYGDHADMVLAALIDSDTDLGKAIEHRDYWHGEAMSATRRIIELERKLRRLTGETPVTTGEAQVFTPPAHYRGRDGAEFCVHAIPVGPDSCPACRKLGDHDKATAGPSAVDEVVAALQAKAQALSVEAEEEMRRDLEEQAQVWHEAADLARRAARKAARGAQAVVEARQDGSR